MSNTIKPKAVVLLSGGLDSTTVLAIALSQGFEVYALSIDYGQRQQVELEAAKRVASAFPVAEHRIVSMNMNQFGGSALTDHAIDVPSGRDVEAVNDIPVTYVPARNTIFLSLALGWAEVLDAYAIFVGVNAVDYSGYPDCRPEFIEAFEQLANLATAKSTEGKGQFRIHTPLISLTKAQIIQKGLELGVNYGITLSCYAPTPAGEACGQCDACIWRLKGFEACDVADPAAYDIKEKGEYGASSCSI